MTPDSTIVDREIGTSAAFSLPCPTLRVANRIRLETIPAIRKSRTCLRADGHCIPADAFDTGPEIGISFMPVTSPIDLCELLTIAEEAARAGGQVLQDWRGRFSVREKSRANLVTEADHASQELIHRLISGRYPDHGFLGEEGLNLPAKGSPWQWIIDPLDGTSNYVHGFPYYAVSIAVRYDSELIAGVIFDPTRNELFAATAGGGAYLNGRQISASGEREPSGAMVMASLPVGGRPEDPAVQRFLKAFSHLQAVQRSGSAALNLACVASGRIDGFWSTSLHPWDVAAGVLIVQEAGGTVTTLKGHAIDISVPDILAASSPELSAALIGILR